MEIIKKFLSGRAVIINNTLDKFHESYNRANMLEYSRENGATHVIAFDCDELLSYNFVYHFNDLNSDTVRKKHNRFAMECVFMKEVVNQEENKRFELTKVDE